MTFAKALAALVLTASAAIVSAADGDPPAVVGRLSYVAGQVSFAPAQADEDWVAASLNRPVTTGDRLWTDTGGRAEIHVGSLAVRMDSQTSLDVLNLDDRGLQLRLAQGSANVRVRRAAGGEPVEIATPGGAVVLMRPGAYRVNVDQQGTVTSVSVRGGGQAEVFASNGSFLVREGEQATIAGSREDIAIAPPPDEFDRWAAVRDRREDRVAATRYVPPAMTGYEDLDQYGTWRTVPQYGTVWQPTAVPAGWAPYRNGHWVWIAPWGWTWVDDEPWGFAPSHYGRWIWLGRSWAWAPGHIVARPVYAPALVAFIGGPSFSVSIGAGSAPAVGWVPLGWQEPYRPWYRASHTHVRELNIANVTNITSTNVRYVNRSAPSGVTVVSRENFAGARPLNRAVLRVSPQTVAAARVTAGPPVTAPSTASLAQARPGARPPAEIRRREAVAVSTPPQSPARMAMTDKGEGRPRAAPASENERPRVRVIDRRERVNPARAEPQRAAEKQVQTAPSAADASARERAEKAEARQRHADERRAPAPPADVATRPTFDRSGRVQAAPQLENRGARAQDGERDATQEQAVRQLRERVEAERQRQAAGGEKKAQQQRAQNEAQQREQAQRAERQAQQRAEQQGHQRAQVDAARQQEREAQRAQAEARQHDQAQRAERQSQQRAQQQAEQRAQQQAERQTQQRAQAEARQQQQAQRAEQQSQQRAQQQGQEQARQQRRESSEKGGNERPRPDKSEKG